MHIQPVSRKAFAQLIVTAYTIRTADCDYIHYLSIPSVLQTLFERRLQVIVQLYKVFYDPPPVIENFSNSSFSSSIIVRLVGLSIIIYRGKLSF